jgi:tetratricopeptide (TPR) repeat protein
VSETPRKTRHLAPLWAVLVVLGGGALFALKLDPTLWTVLADRELRAGRLVEAELDYQRALAIDVDHGPALYGLGWAYWRAGLTEPARERFTRAVEFAPDYHGGYRGLAALEAARGETLAAEEKLRIAHALAPDEPGILADLAGLYADEGYADPCVTLFDRAIALAPRRAEFQLSKAEACVTLGDVACAAAAVDRAAELELTETRFAGALDELRFRITLAEVEGALEATVGGGGDCAGIRGQLSAAQAYLDEALVAGLEDRIAAVDRRRLEDLRGEVEERCGATQR